VEDDGTLRQALDAVRARIAKKRPEAERLAREVQELETAEAALQALVPGNTVHVELTDSGGASDSLVVSRRPASTDAVRVILQDHPDERVHIDDIRREMAERDWIDPEWKTPEAAVYAALKRLTARDKRVVRVARREWMYVVNTLPNTLVEESDDDEDDPPTPSDAM
jgi:hypothetical protein